MTDMRQLINELDYRDEDGIRHASLTFSISLFTGATFADIPQAVLCCQELFFEFCPQERIRFYATENMRKHRTVNKKVFGMLDLWSKNLNTRGDFIALELKDGDMEQDTPKYLFNFVTAEKGSSSFEAKSANSIVMAFPPEFGIDRSEEMYGLMRRLLEVLPCTSASAGFGFLCSRYSPRLGETFAWQKSMRHPEIDIVRVVEDTRAAGQNALKTVSWLTMVCDAFVTELGGIKAVEKNLGSRIAKFPLQGGMLFRIGEAPTISDRNRGESVPDYKSLHMALHPLIERAREEAMWFSSGKAEEEGEQCDAWFRRFEQ